MIVEFRAFIYEDERKDDTYQKKPTNQDVADILRVKVDMICMIMKM